MYMHSTNSPQNFAPILQAAPTHNSPTTGAHTTPTAGPFDMVPVMANAHATIRMNLRRSFRLKLIGASGSLPTKTGESPSTQNG